MDMYAILSFIVFMREREREKSRNSVSMFPMSVKVLIITIFREKKI